MKTPKASERLVILQGYDATTRKSYGWNISGNNNWDFKKNNAFKTEKQAQYWLNDLDNVVKCKEQVKRLRGALNEILNFRNEKYSYRWRIIKRLEQALKETE